MPQTARETPVLSAISTQLADAVERVGRSLVHVDGRPRYGATGTVWATDLVLAADHTLEREDNLSLGTPDGRTLAAELIGRDPTTDLAVLRAPGLALPAAQAALSPARVGQFALAVGRPNSEGSMASLGVVSGVGGPLRTMRGPVLEQFIRTDATPYPGFSGGPLIDADGGVLGIVTSGLIRGVGVAIPMAIAARVAETLSRQGYVSRPYLGVGLQPVRLPQVLRRAGGPDQGLLIVSVGEESPAARDGLMLGDIIVGLDGHAVADIEAFQSRILQEAVDAACAVEIVRGGARTVVTVRLGQRSRGSRA